jgi:hypothetical protein
VQSPLSIRWIRTAAPQATTGCDEAGYLAIKFVLYTIDRYFYSQAN